MKISIVTVCYNSAATIVDTLRSVATQTHPDIEHIIIDGASKDDTMLLVRTHGTHVSRAISEPDRGLYDAMNKGLSLATGDAVGFLNSDDLFADSGAVARLAHALQPESVDAVYGDLVFVSPNETSHVVRYWRSTPYQRGGVQRGWAPAHPTFYVKRAAFQRLGGFDTDFRIAADFELALRLLDVAGLTAVQIPHVLVRMRTGGRSTRNLSAVLAGNREAMRACRKHGLPGGLRFVASKLARRVPQLFVRPTSTKDGGDRG